MSETIVPKSCTVGPRCPSHPVYGLLCLIPQTSQDSLPLLPCIKVSLFSMTVGLFL